LHSATMGRFAFGTSTTRAHRRPVKSSQVKSVSQVKSISSSSSSTPPTCQVKSSQVNRSSQVNLLRLTPDRYKTNVLCDFTYPTIKDELGEPKFTYDEKGEKVPAATLAPPPPGSLHGPRMARPPFGASSRPSALRRAAPSRAAPSRASALPHMAYAWLLHGLCVALCTALCMAHAPHRSRHHPRPASTLASPSPLPPPPPSHLPPPRPHLASASILASASTLASTPPHGFVCPSDCRSLWCPLVLFQVFSTCPNGIEVFRTIEGPEGQPKLAAFPPKAPYRGKKAVPLAEARRGAPCEVCEEEESNSSANAKQKKSEKEKEPRLDIVKTLEVRESNLLAGCS
jgi:hypothetical protein